MSGLIFVGELRDSNVVADVYFNDSRVSLSGPVYFDLDQWLELRRTTSDLDDVWAATKTEYEDATESVPT